MDENVLRILTMRKLKPGEDYIEGRPSGDKPAWVDPVVCAAAEGCVFAGRTYVYLNSLVKIAGLRDAEIKLRLEWCYREGGCEMCGLHTRPAKEANG